MFFHELKVGDKFTSNNVEFVKVQEQKISCCKIKCNAKKVEDQTDAVFKPKDTVEKVA